jgi:MOSC domain-containing protein YiiM
VAGVIELRAVNVAVPSVIGEVRGERVWSGIAKRPVDPAVTLWLSLLDLAGDGQADLTVHGGPDKAVYAYPSEHLPAWCDELGADLGPAAFGENLETAGVLESDVRIGDVWSWGGALLQVCQPRWPCFKLALHRGRSDVQVAMRRTGRTGWYLRVLEPGVVPAAGPIEVTRQDPAGITVADAHHAMADLHLDDRAAVEAVAAHPALAGQWRDPLVERLSRPSPSR